MRTTILIFLIFYLQIFAAVNQFEIHWNWGTIFIVSAALLLCVAQDIKQLKD